MIDDVATSLWIFQLIPLSASYMRQWTGPSMVQVMACRLFGTKLPEPILIYCQFQFYPWEQVSVKFKSEFHHGLLSYRQRPKVDNKIFVQTRPLRDWHNRWLVQFCNDLCLYRPQLLAWCHVLCISSLENQWSGVLFVVVRRGFMHRLSIDTFRKLAMWLTSSWNQINKSTYRVEYQDNCNHSIAYAWARQLSRVQTQLISCFQPHMPHMH